jgi:mRNA-degrading endonuclease toxin of MazEF toxin-antitoxin module
MVDRLMTTRLTRVGEQIGSLSASDMAELDRAIAFALGFKSE